MAELVESVVKAARVLRAFEPHSGAMTVREVAARTGIPRSTVHALCTTLVEVRMLEALPEGGYRLGPATAWLGAQVFERTGLVEAAVPTMHSLARIAGAQVDLSQYVSKGWMVFLHHVADARLRSSSRMGSRVPAHECAEGRAVLSQFESLEIREIVVRASGDLGAPGVDDNAAYAQLLRCLAQGRQHGFVVMERARSNLRTVAAPLRDPDGVTVGALSVSMARPSVNERRVAQLGEALRAANHEISQRLATRGR